MKDQELAGIIIGKLMNIGGMLQKKANQLLFPFNLNQQQFSILFEIAKAEKVTQKTVINRLLLEKAHVSKIVKKLNEMNLIDITVCDEDKRSSWLTITKMGIKVVTECSKTLQEWNAKWVKELDVTRNFDTLSNLTELQKIFRKATE